MACRLGLLGRTFFGCVWLLGWEFVITALGRKTIINIEGKMLKTENTLVIHEREHTGERPFNCAICGNGYKSSSVLGTHMKHVHKVISPGMKPIEKRVRKNKDLI